MTTYKSYNIETTEKTIGSELHGGRGNRYLLKITDKNGHAIRNANGDLPLITTVERAKSAINAEMEGRA